MYCIISRKANHIEIIPISDHFADSNKKSLVFFAVSSSDDQKLLTNPHKNTIIYTIILFSEVR